MSDLISRLDALVAIQETPWYSQDKNKEMINGAWDEHIGWYKAYDIYQALEQVPSAEPTLYGYNLDYLIAFALACERAGVSNDDLKMFANNYEFAFDTVQKEFEKSVLAEMARRCEREGE